MANNFSASFEEIWALEQQRVFYKENVAMKVADISFNSTMKSGDTLNRTYRSTNKPEVYVRGTDITEDAKTDTLEQLSVNLQYANMFYRDDFDQIQDKYDIAQAYGYDNGIFLSNQVDADVLGETVNATSTVDDGDLGNTAGNGISLDATNILSVVSAAKRKIKKQNVPLSELKAVISSEFEEVLIQYGAGRDTRMGDASNENGYIMKFYDFELYGSNQLTGTAVMAMATQPTDGDTVTIAGVTFTFKTTLGTTAGNVLIGASADAARANLTALINAPDTTTAQGVALTGDNLRLVSNQLSAVNDDTANTMTVTGKGIGVLVVSETFTDATDEWTAATQIQHNLFMAGKNPVLVMQSMPKVETTRAQARMGSFIKNAVLYGVKTFTDNAKRMVDVKIRSNTFDA